MLSASVDIDTKKYAQEVNVNKIGKNGNFLRGLIVSVILYKKNNVATENKLFIILRDAISSGRNSTNTREITKDNIFRLGFKKITG